MRHLKTLLTVLGAVTVLILAGNTVALATTGHAFILGKSNSANKITSLSRTTNGTALKVHTKSNNNAPLSVNGHGKVANLNADLVDGLDSSKLQNRVIRYRLPASSGADSYFWNLPGLPAGTYMATYSVYTLTNISSGQCWLLKPAHSAFKLVSDAAVSSTATWNASGVVTTNDVSQLHCVGNSAFTVNTATEGPTEVTFTRIDGVTSGTGVTARLTSGARTVAH